MLRQQVWANVAARATILAVALMSTLVACKGDGSQGPATGIVEGTVTTTGDNQDADGYTVTVDGRNSTIIEPNGIVRFTRVTAGTRTVGLGGIANNCAVADANPRSVTVSANGVTQVSFAVTCTAIDPALQTGSVQVTVATTGSDLDADGYVVSVDGGPAQVIGTDGTLTVANVEVGTRSVTLSGIAPNCTVADQSTRSVTVTANATASTTFQVTCGAAAATGSIGVTVATSGSNPDADGYAVSVDGGTPQTLAVNGSTTFTSIAAGTRTVQLSGVAGNCTIAGENPRQVAVTAGAAAAVAFQVTCTAESRILFLSTREDPNAEIYSANSDGSDVQRLTNNNAKEGDASWSPDYQHIVFSSDSARAGDFDVYVMDANGTNVRRLTRARRDDGFAVYSPDGTQLAFTSDRGTSTDVYVMSADGDGSDARPVGNSDGVDQLPGWSPDGAKIVFASNRGGNFELYAVNADGTGTATQLTNNPAVDQLPAYSPDGSKIVFISQRDDMDGDIYVMNADGTGEPQRLTSTPGVDSWPRWSPDGTRIIFRSTRDGNSELYTMSADGTGTPVRVTTDPAEDFRPSWRP